VEPRLAAAHAHRRRRHVHALYGFTRYAGEIADQTDGQPAHLRDQRRRDLPGCMVPRRTRLFVVLRSLLTPAGRSVSVAAVLARA